MTVPAIFYATDSPIAAICGFIVALTLAFFEKGLVIVAALSSIAVLICQLIV